MSLKSTWVLIWKSSEYHRWNVFSLVGFQVYLDVCESTAFKFFLLSEFMRSVRRSEVTTGSVNLVVSWLLYYNFHVRRLFSEVEREKRDFIKMGNKISSLPVCAKARKTNDSLKKRVTSTPTYKKFLTKRDKLANRIRDGILAFFSILGPCWTFLFVKKPDSDETSPGDSKIS